MNKKLVLFDVDDTLIDHSSERSDIPKVTREAIRRLQEEGHEVGLATGRSEAHIRDIMKFLHMDTAVCFGGHMVISKNKIIHRVTLDQDEVSAIIKKMYRTVYPVICFDESNIYVKDFFGKVKKEMYRKENTLVGERQLTEITPIKKLDLHKRDYLGMMIFRYKLKNEDDYKKLDFNHWGKEGFEVYAKGVSKFSGVQIIAKHLNIPIEDVYVFGDSYNDIHMLRNIKHSVAVGNGVKDAKEAATHVCPPINQGGIMTACMELGLLSSK